MKSGIYKITNQINNKIYIGSSKSIQRRFTEHKSKLRANKHANVYLQNAWNKYGESIFSFEVLEFCNLELLISIEQNYLDLLKPIYNLCKIAGTVKGRPMKESTKLLVSLRHKNKIISDETKQRLSDSHKGIKSSLESSKRKSESMRKRFGGKKVIGYNEKETLYFNDIYEASDYFGTKPQLIKNVIIGKTKSYCKLKWKYE